MTRKYVNRIFEDTSISLRDLSATDVIFNRCKLKYDGCGDLYLIGCDFNECRLVFSGIAGNTIQFLRELKAMGRSYDEIIDGGEP